MPVAWAIITAVANVTASPLTGTAAASIAALIRQSSVRSPTHFRSELVSWKYLPLFWPTA